MVSSKSRSFTRSGGLFGSSSMIQSCILLDAALERCGNAPSSELDPTALASAATCCDFELGKLAQACWTCSQRESTDEACAAAISTADVALGMSTCAARSSMSALLSSPAQPPPHDAGVHLRLQQRSPHRAFVSRGDGDEDYTGPSPVFLVVFFSVISVLAIAVAALIVHRCRQAQPYRKRAHRRAVLDLMEGFTPVDEKRRSDVPEPPWVHFQPDNGIVSPPPLARSRTPSPTPEDMYDEIPRGLASPRLGVRPVAHGRVVPQLVLTPPLRYENGAAVMASPMTEPVPIRRY